MADDSKRGEKQFRRWLSEIQNAQKDMKYRVWLLKCEKIVRRYRDERNDTLSSAISTKRYNILWANVQTLGPAVYGKEPKPIAERRFQDRDPAARMASMILERVLAFQMSVGNFHEAAQQAIHKDYLLPGMGQMWVRYYAEISSSKTAEEDDELEAEQANETPENAGDEGFGEVYDKLDYERLCFDYVYWRDFLWSPSRTWAEVPWVAKRCWLDYAASEEQFGQEIADRMTFGEPKNREMVDTMTNSQDAANLGKSKKAEVWEIWCKPERRVYFIAPESPGFTLKEEDDPLNLEGFWPCPEPLFATQTNDTIVPVPDYLEYQDQAMELDDLTDRIDNITSAVRANGVYDSQWPAIQRLMQKGQDNVLLPVQDMSKFSGDAGGLKSVVQLLPMEEIITVLSTLHEARDKVLQDVYQITGLSDILRGVTDPRETMGAQKIKANYATGRLGSRQQHVADFCVNTIRIAGELIAEIFSDQSLRQMSGIDQMFADQIRQALEEVPKPQPPNLPPNSPPQAMQMAQQQAKMQYEQAKAQAAQTKTQELEGQFQQALKILRSDKLRGFRVDIETDSTIADDLQQDKQAVIEYMQGLFSSIQGAEQTLAQAPELLKPMGDTLMWAARKMRVGRTLEASWEDALDKLVKRVEDMKNQPPKPDPEMIKAESQAQLAQMKGQVEQVRSQADVQATNLKSQAEQARAQADIQVQTIQLRSEQAQQALKARLDAATLQVDQLKAAATNNTQLKLASMTMLDHITVALIGAKAGNDSAAIDAQLEKVIGFMNIQHEAVQNQLDREHEVNMTTMQQAHDQTMQEKQGVSDGKNRAD